MKSLCTIFFFGMLATAFGQVADPLRHYKSAHQLNSSDKILTWDGDITGSGQRDIFFTDSKKYSEDQKAHLTPSWNLYLAGVKGYIACTGTAQGEIFSPALPLISLDHCFIGQIGELGKHGIVTEQTNRPKQGDSVTTVYAYTVEDDHLRRTVLATFDPDEGANPIFDKYLKDGNRTVINFRQLKP